MMNTNHTLSRRGVLRSLAAMAASGACGDLKAHAQPASDPKRVAAVVTVYRKNSHADVIVGKILDGWKQDGGPGPNLQLASMYVDQFTRNDLAREICNRKGVPILDTIEEALTLGNKKIAVDGVLSIGEHGDYPFNEKGQHLYPRRRFFAEIANAMERFGHVVPVFSDKHLSTVWRDARWIYQRARQLNIPLMAGSSVPLAFRKPDITIPIDCQIADAVGIGYGGLDSYGFHALEFLQAFVERRKGAETGIEWVQCLQHDEMWKAVDNHEIDEELLRAALDVVPKVQTNRRLRDLTGDNVALFRFAYRDGLQAALFMLNGHARGISLAVRLHDNKRPMATHADLRERPAFPHFAYLLKAIERMIHTGQPPYAVERTLLTSGLLDQLLTSRVQDHQKLATPELSIAYKSVDYPHAPRPELTRN